MPEKLRSLREGYHNLYADTDGKRNPDHVRFWETGAGTQLTAGLVAFQTTKIPQKKSDFERVLDSSRRNLVLQCRVSRKACRSEDRDGPAAGRPPHAPRFGGSEADAGAKPSVGEAGLRDRHCRVSGGHDDGI